VGIGDLRRVAVVAVRVEQIDSESAAQGVGVGNGFFAQGVDAGVSQSAGVVAVGDTLLRAVGHRTGSAARSAGKVCLDYDAERSGGSFYSIQTVKGRGRGVVLLVGGPRDVSATVLFHDICCENRAVDFFEIAVQRPQSVL